MTAIGVGRRTLLAMTCSKCGELKQGSEFDRYPRKAGEPFHYLTRRCRPCRWAKMAASWAR